VATVFWAGDSCTVWLDYRADGGLEFNGQDLGGFGTPGDHYEYVVTVPIAEFGALRRALRVSADADVLAAVCANVARIMPGGEASWLTRHGIEHDVSVWHDPPD